MFQVSCPYNQKREKILNNIRESIVSRGGKLLGDQDRGQFHVGERLGRFSGHYEITHHEINITFTHKPFYLSPDEVKSVLDEYFRRQWIGGSGYKSVELHDEEELLELA